MTESMGCVGLGKRGSSARLSPLFPAVFPLLLGFRHHERLGTADP